ncbi:hypothetical protein [Nocardioides sp. P5_E3]
MSHDGARGLTANQLKLREFREQFTRSTEFGAQLLAYLTRSGCGVWRLERDSLDRRRWWLNITLSENVAEMFDAHLELQLVYAEYDRVEPRLLELAQQRIRKDPRVDPGLFVLATCDPSVDRMVRRRRGEFAVIDLDLRNLGSDQPEVRHRMAEVLTSVDHYDITAPIKDPSGFFGRQAEFDRMISALDRGQSTGVFGLRKAGKTSLLNLVAGKRREAARPVVTVDISGLSDADDFRRRFVEGAFKAAQDLKAGDQDFSSLPRLKTLSSTGDSRGGVSTLRSHWLKDIELIIDYVGDHLEVFIDEIDQAYPARSYLGPEEAQHLLIALTQLRGLIQGADDRSGIVLVCAGTDPALFERPLLPSGADNLLYKLVRLMFLSPMSRDEMAEMVRDLGRRMGIRIREHAVIDYLFAEYGGHPLLSRKACSLASAERPKGDVPWHLLLPSVLRAANARGEGTPLQQSAEILDSYSEWFPEEAVYLRSLWSPDLDERNVARMLLEEDGRHVAHAAPYGLLIPDSLTARIRSVERSMRDLAAE